MDILALSPTYGRIERSMQYAGELALQTNASLTGLYISEPLPIVATPMAIPEFYTLATDLAQAAIEAEPAFQKWAQGLGIMHSRWVVAEGYLGNAISQISNQHDLLVLESGTGVVWGSPGSLGKLALSSGLPCLIVPQDFGSKALIDAIALAWNGSSEAMRAIHAALPLIKRAKKVLLIHGQREEPFTSVLWRPQSTIENYLASHEIAFQTEYFEASGEVAGRRLLEVAHKAHADLLVMGAYGHARFSEWMLGGATLYVLEHATLPIFLRH